MTDIVERLHARAAECERTTAHDNKDHYLHVVAKLTREDGSRMKEAANEIEKLRKQVRIVTLDYLAADGQAADLVEENTKLRAALEVTSSDCKEAFAENESLRLALEVAANDLDDWGAYTKANNARAALEGK